MDIGSELRRARLARRLTLDDIARSTKISHSVLRALEKNAFEDVPGGLFTRGYLRAYAASVGLDPEPIVDAYRAAFDPAVMVVAEPDSADAESGHADPHWSEQESDASSRHSEMLQFGVILIVAVVYLISLRHPKPAPELQAAETVSAGVPAAVAATAPVSDTKAVGTSGSMDTVKPLAIEIHPTAPCWVDVTADGTHVIGRLMDAGDRQSFTVRDELTIRVGDPGTFAFSVDGAAGRPLGLAGQAVTVHINRSNYRTFLAAAAAG